MNRIVSIAFCVIAVAGMGLHNARAQNLIADGSFEDGAVPHCSQGVVPSTWYTASVTPDVYSSDCGVLPGLGLAAFGNFTTILDASDGLRFVAGGTHAGTEAFGQLMASALIPEHRYRLSGFFANSDRIPSPGVFDIHLSTSADILDGVYVGSIGSTGVVGSWTADEMEFCAPEDADQRPYIIMWPRHTGAGTYYAGTDDWSLVHVENCSVVATESTSWSSAKSRFR